MVGVAVVVGVAVKTMSDVTPEPFSVYRALEERFSGDGWATFHEVRNGTGFVNSLRSCDVLAMSTWPSRGLELHGIEVKTARSDWLRELKDPPKADEGIFKYCDRWWLAVNDRAIVQAEELPKNWGLLGPRGGKLVALKQAPPLTPVPLDREFVASLVRHAATLKPSDDRVARLVEAARTEGHRKGKEKVESRHRWDQKEHKNAYEKIKYGLDRFQKDAGIDPLAYGAGETYRKFLRFVEREDCAFQAEILLRWMETRAEDLRGALSELKAQKNGAGGDVAAQKEVIA